MKLVKTKKKLDLKLGLDDLENETYTTGKG